MSLSFFLWVLLGFLGFILILFFIYERFFQTKNIVRAHYPLLGNSRYLFHELRPFFRQYFGDDNAFTPRIIIDWILDSANGKTGYFGFDKFDSTRSLHDGKHQMIHSSTPKNADEMKPQYPIVGQKNRKFPLEFKGYFYRSAMSLGALSFEATSAMFAACADEGIPANTGEGGLSIHHIPRLKFQYKYKFLKYQQVPKFLKFFFYLTPGRRMKNHFIDLCGHFYCEKHLRNASLFCEDNFVFYKIDWQADLRHFPKPEDLNDEYGKVIYQIGSNLNGLKNHEGKLDWERFTKTTRFCRAIEIKLAQGAKQSGGILKAAKNVPVIAEIRGIKPFTDLVSPNRFPYYEKNEEEAFLDFCEKLSEKSGGKPIGAKIVISNKNNAEPLIKTMTQTKKYLDFITVDGGDGGSGAAPIALSVLFGKKIDQAIPIVDQLLKKYEIRDHLKLFAAAKIYAPHTSARIMALGADAIGNARSIMISAGCIRAGLCSGEHGDCPVGIATMNKSNRNAFAQAWDQKVQNVRNYLLAQNHGLEQVAAICGVDSPSKLNLEHIAQ